LLTVVSGLASWAQTTSSVPMTLLTVRAVTWPSAVRSEEARRAN